MKDKAMEIGAKVKETMVQAQKQLQGLEEEVQKFAARVQDKIVSSPLEGARKVEDMLRNMAVRDFVDKVKTIEMLKQGQAVKKELLDRFGIAGSDEIDSLRKKVTELETRVQKMNQKATASAPASNKGPRRK